MTPALPVYVSRAMHIFEGRGAQMVCACGLVLTALEFGRGFGACPAPSGARPAE